MANREELLKALKNMSPEDRAKPIVMRMGGEDPNHNIVTGEELLKSLEGEELSFGSPTPNPGGIVSKNNLLNKLNKMIK